MDDPYQTGMPPFGLKFPESANPMAHANGLQECRASRSPSISPSRFVSEAFFRSLFSPRGLPADAKFRRTRLKSQQLKPNPLLAHSGTSKLDVPIRVLDCAMNLCVVTKAVPTFI